jgi:hypothetical protein
MGKGMESQHLSCEQVRARALELIASQDVAPNLADHLSTCEDCEGLLLEAALHQAPQVLIPAGFAKRAASLASSRSRSVFPYVVAAALALYVVLTLLWAPAIELTTPIVRFTGTLTKPSILLSLLGLETLLSSAWLWRVVRSA